MAMTNTHNITINSPEDIDTLAYFANQASIYENKKWKNEYERITSKEVYDFLPLIIDVRNGYVVLEDKTIRCSPFASDFVAQFECCLESEMHAEFNAAIMGY